MNLTLRFQQLAEDLCHYGRILYNNDWSPATSSNYSARLDDQYCALTSSGKHKGELTPADILVVDWQGRAVNPEGISNRGKPSAETLLHTQIYQRYPQAGAVLHTHSRNAVLLSALWPQAELELTGWELQKAIEGQNSHESRLVIPIVDNDQNIPRMAEGLDPLLLPECRAYLIRGHGIYTWGHNLADCFRHLEALDHLCAYQLELIRLGQMESRQP
ncbi:methylthioribulose 1-phosphate dehydratase [Parathalassolituus penaei]|uniref:Methylthioribulose-1-phosphate dehydratase n=1 Tax=Parathalassolituus penaei TaxID=2997323 RepID=A0A9X3EB51_9GAMM|nr:methylthioribulose 1-phosphate dehydratase [Parathalassolituus penaei]MCY0964367.1 methylthioribulose 1-phosphate dehydratase [Parathalassolituus penaei]